MFNKTRWESHDGKYIIEIKNHSFRAMPQTAGAKERRKRKEKETTLAQEEINSRLRCEKYERLILDNFETGDCYLTCTYRENPVSAERVKKDWENFKEKLRRYFKNHLGKEFKYLAILENLFGGGRPHGHMLMPGIPREAIKAIKKKWPHGNVEIKTYGGEAMDAHRLSEYFNKDGIYKKSSGIQTSKNLIRTEPKKEIVFRSETFADRMKAPAGYHIVDELSYRGYTSEGYPIIKIFMERDEEKNERKRSKLSAADKILCKQHRRKLAASEPGI